MVTRQRSPSFFFKYQALISPPGPPPTIARSNMSFPSPSGPPAFEAAGLNRISKSAFHPEGKMNKAGPRNAAMKESSKMAALRRPFVFAPYSCGSVIPPTNGPKGSAFATMCGCLTAMERLSGEQADQFLLAREAGFGQYGLELAAHRLPVDARSICKCIDG